VKKIVEFAIFEKLTGQKKQNNWELFWPWILREYLYEKIAMGPIRASSGWPDVPKMKVSKQQAPQTGLTVENLISLL
jgi:hypothetical protein